MPFAIEIPCQPSWTCSRSPRQVVQNELEMMQVGGRGTQQPSDGRTVGTVTAPRSRGRTAGIVVPRTAPGIVRGQGVRSQSRSRPGGTACQEIAMSGDGRRLRSLA